MEALSCCDADCICVLRAGIFDSGFQEVALYTDLDIMWMRHIDQSEFDRMKPQQHFAVAYGSQLRTAEMGSLVPDACRGV